MAEDTQQITPKEVRQARGFLQSRGFGTSDIPPRLFAITAKRTKRSFLDLLQFIAKKLMGGQGVGQSAETEDKVSQ